MKDSAGQDWRFAIYATKSKTKLGWQPTATYESGIQQNHRLLSRQRGYLLA
jgi:dTDP-D-glucose 4,6-dehydratase